MPHDDYTASAGGALKLKGVNSASKISKPHKKKRPKPRQPAESSDTVLGTGKQAEKTVGDEFEGSLSKTGGSEQSDNDEVDGKSMGEEGVILKAVGKTEAERRHEERRRKRVCEILLLPPLNTNCSSHLFSTVNTSPLSSPSVASFAISGTSILHSIPISLTQLSLTKTISLPFLTPTQLDERLKREGTKTHKERVEELNRYLSNLSEHHDMYVPTIYLRSCLRCYCLRIRICRARAGDR